MVATLPALMMLCSKARPDEIVQYEALTGVQWNAPDAAFDYYGRQGEKFMLLDNAGAPVCAAGWEPLRPGVAQGWMVGTMDDWRLHWRAITKHSRLVMQHMLANGTHRLQIHCLKSRTQAANWYVKGLKMQHNGDLPCYGVNGETASLYARVGGS